LVRRWAIAAALLGLAVSGPTAALAHTHRGDDGRRRHRERSSNLTAPRETLACGDWPRTGGSVITASARGAAARAAFRRCEPCPSTGLFTGRCPGYVVDHIVALKRGGADEPANMQWQSYEEAKRKDRIE
jgi:hypothetical protein